MLFALASEQIPDAQGRITITPELRKYAELEGEVVVIGLYNRLEIWQPAKWEAYTDMQEPSYSDIQEEILPGF